MLGATIQEALYAEGRLAVYDICSPGQYRMVITGTEPSSDDQFSTKTRDPSRFGNHTFWETVSVVF
jgi:hypothetical protein